VSVATVASALVGILAGYLAWWVAERFIARRSLEKGDTELRIGLPIAVALAVPMFGLIGWRYTADVRMGVVVLGLFGVFLALLLVDFARYVLPNVLVGIALVWGLAGSAIVLATSGRADGIVYPVAGALTNFAVYLVFWFIAVLLFGNRGLGFGDVKLAAPLGVAIGVATIPYQNVVALIVWAVFIGFGSGALASIVLLRGVRLKRAFPQGPFLVLGTLVVVAFPSSFVG
jgi:leader peptidase (prepilin peptidase)/N-methyltransferase